MSFGTKKCVACGQPAKVWTGHVLTDDGKHVIAGWCKVHIGKLQLGLHGRWRKWMGRERGI